jgi:hypothetical protein
MNSPISSEQHIQKVSRRSIFVGITASLVCAPSIVRATSLMPVHSLLLPPERPYPGFAKLLFYHSLDCGLRSGQKNVMLKNRGLSESEARRMVA